MCVTTLSITVVLGSGDGGGGGGNSIVGGSCLDCVVLCLLAERAAIQVAARAQSTCHFDVNSFL